VKIIIAPDSFKGNLSSIQVAGYIAAGIRKADPQAEIIEIPVADGGEGSVEALVTAAGGKILTARVTGPLGNPVDSFWGLLADGQTAVIEMAAAAGLHLVPRDQRNPMLTTTRGVGELILEALNHEVERIIMCIGGSSTNDAGTGMIQALGGLFLDSDRAVLGDGGQILSQIAQLDLSSLDQRLKKIKFITACDVQNPLFGLTGAAHIYAPQKGADAATVQALDKGLENFAQISQRNLGIDVAEMPGAGAAGGLGFALLAFLQSKMLPGIEVVMDAVDFDHVIRGADLLITGEGRTDGQTAFGKVPVGLAGVAARHGVPVICLSGGLADNYEAIYDLGVTAAFSNVLDAMPLGEAMARSGDMLTKSAYALTRLMLALYKR